MRYENHELDFIGCILSFLSLFALVAIGVAGVRLAIQMGEEPLQQQVEERIETNSNE